MNVLTTEFAISQPTWSCTNDGIGGDLMQKIGKNRPHHQRQRRKGNIASFM